MITRHCLRYSFNLCPKQVKGLRPDPLILINGKEKLTLRFDCKASEMHVVGKLRKQRTRWLSEKSPTASIAVRRPGGGDKPTAAQ